MGVIRSASDRARGLVAASLQNRVAADLDAHVREVLDAAVMLWAQANWHSYDQNEDNCTVQLYRWCGEVMRGDRRYALLTLQFQWIRLTPEMLEGFADATTAMRPDLHFHVGSAGRALECKRLALTGQWARKYVREGLARFVVGGYGDGEDVGFMVGYCQDGELDAVIERVNEQVLLDTRLDATQVLETVTVGVDSSWSRSCHPRPAGSAIRLEHLLVRQRAF